MSQSSDFANDHRVRIMEINEDEQAVIRVRTKFHVSLVFSRFTIDVFEKDGVVYTRQEVNGGSEDDTQSIGEPEYGSELETQPIDWVDQFTTPDDPPEVVQCAGGDFNQVNEKHASRLEMTDVKKDLVSIAEELEYRFDEAGDTQIEIEEEGSTQIEIEEEGFTQIDDSYTDGGLYIPYYQPPGLYYCNPRL
jgi:hypothetical protein